MKIDNNDFLNMAAAQNKEHQSSVQDTLDQKLIGTSEHITKDYPTDYGVQTENGVIAENATSSSEVISNGYHPASSNDSHNGSIHQRCMENGKPKDQVSNEHSNGIQNGSTRTLDGYYNKKLPTISEIKAAIPRHCFKPTIAQSLYHVAKDFIIISVLFLLGQWILGCKSLLLQALLSPVYWFAQGTLFFAVFVLGHDCNHGSFSSYAFFNDCLGTVLHAMVMTPYYPWKLSHRHHHNNTGNIDKDEIFYPIRKRDDNKNKFLPLFGLGFGWIAYLWKGFGPRPMNHWIPTHALFSKHTLGCILSVVSVGIWVFCLYYYAVVMGWVNLVYHYVVPVFICACYIVIVTFLHHSDLDIPWYSDANWENVKGKLSSVDREYGLIHDVIHTIGTHQVHHLFPVIPHYYLREATTHFRQAFPQFVHNNETGILPAFWKMFYKYTSQCVIANDASIHFYK